MKVICIILVTEMFLCRQPHRLLLSLLSRSRKSFIDKLQRVLNAAERVVTKTRKYGRGVLLYKFNYVD